MRHFFALLILAFPVVAFSQSTYWQQQVDYKIDVSLNDVSHELIGFVSINYKNNSPDTLRYIYFHLWPNAYRDQTTPFAKQMLRNGDTKFWFSKERDKGYIDNIRFKTDEKVAEWKFDSGSIEICKVFLDKPLAPGREAKISTSFHVKLPYTFSRMGHVRQSYQISQWYPKPAVYDKYGWHPFPYLDQGEFYSEYGSFDVSITLPENYIVGATGDLQDSSEIKWMDQKAEQGEKNLTHFRNDNNDAFPASSEKLKTIHFKQTNIHDFAWFADKRYHVLKGEVLLPVTNKKVTTWALFLDRQAGYWAQAPKYISDALFFYSQWVGNYPYEQVTAVEGALGAGGGMEYPNITVIGDASSDWRLDQLITHEVGHNWFYGILGSNERDHAWMDEGINSYYEYRYLLRKYPNKKLAGEYLSKDAMHFFDLYQYNAKYFMDLGYQFQARENLDQAIDQTSKNFTTLNYDAIVYGKTALLFDYLQNYLGVVKFDKAMQAYYEKWKYKHPQPEDVKQVLDSATGKNLNWLFDDLLKTDKKIDYKITGVTKQDSTLQVTLKNKNKIVSPVSVSLLKKDSVIYTQWVDGFIGSEMASLPNISGADKVQIDPQLNIPEINRKNNTYKLKKVFHKFEKLRLQIIGSIENQNRTQVFVGPYLGWNNYDKTQVGLTFYNPFIPARKFNYLLAPAFGTGSKKFIGYGKMNYNFYPAKKIQQLQIGVIGKRYSYLLFPVNLMFNKIEPYVHVELKKKDPLSYFTSSFHFRSVNVWLGQLTYLPEGYGSETQRYYVNEARYKLERNSTLHPFSILFSIQQSKNFANVSAEGNFMVSYRRKNEGLRIRLFAVGIPIRKDGNDISSPLSRFYLSNVTTANTAVPAFQRDYMFDENFVDRNGANNVFARQVAISQGGFRSINQLSTNRFLSSFNLTTTIYKFIPINPFISGALVLDDGNKLRTAAEMGLSLIAMRDMVEIHFPIITTSNIRDNQQQLGINKWYQRITVTLKLNLPSARKLLGTLM